MSVILSWRPSWSIQTLLQTAPSCPTARSLGRKFSLTPSETTEPFSPGSGWVELYFSCSEQVESFWFFQSRENYSPWYLLWGYMFKSQIINRPWQVQICVLLYFTVYSFPSFELLVSIYISLTKNTFYIVADRAWGRCYYMVTPFGSAHRLSSLAILKLNASFVLAFFRLLWTVTTCPTTLFRSPLASLWPCSSSLSSSST